MPNLQSALGVFAILALAFAISENRRAVPWRPVVVGLVATFALALLMLKVPQAQIVFVWINDAVIALAAATRAGTAFVFGYVGGGPPPFDVKNPGNAFILGFQALPVVLIISVVSSLLFYWRIMPPIVRGFSWALERRSTSAARRGFPPRRALLSAMSRRRCSSGRIWRRFRAAKCSSS